MGENLLEKKHNTLDDQVRTWVSDLASPGDASALEKYYHRKCLCSAQRTFFSVDASNSLLIRSVCDEELLLSVQNTLTDDDVTLSIAQVNEEYFLILKRYQIEVTETGNYRKHLKKLITEQLPSVQFVKSLRKNEPENLVLATAVSKAIDIRSAMVDNGEIIGQLKTMANIRRDEMMEHRNWSFNGSL